MDIDLDQLRDLMQALKDFELDELELEQGEERIVLRRTSAATAVMAAPMASVPPPAPAAPSAAPAAAAAEDDDATYVTSPFVGTFYRAPNPGSEPFVKKGAAFGKGQTLCIVEAMKLMNEIEAEVSGNVLEILVEDGTPVTPGQPLMIIS